MLYPSDFFVCIQVIFLFVLPTNTAVIIKLLVEQQKRTRVEGALLSTMHFFPATGC